MDASLKSLAPVSFPARSVYEIYLGTTGLFLDLTAFFVI